MTVGELMGRMDAMEFTRWQVFYARRRRADEKAARQARRGWQR